MGFDRSSRSQLLFDDGGQLWPADSIELRRRLCCLNYRGDLISDLVRNLGFIVVDVQRSKVAVRYLSATVSPIAATGLLYWLLDNEPMRGYVLDIDARTTELLPSFSSLLARTRALAERGKAFLRAAAKPLSYDLLEPDSPLRKLVNGWNARSGTLFFKDIADIIQRHLGNRYALVRVVDDNRIVVTEVGPGLRVPIQSWFGNVLGSDLETLPDRAYGRWVNEAYFKVHQTGRPAISDCDADIYWPGEGWVRRKYRRLIIPCEAADGGSCLLSTSCTSAQISLRKIAA